MLLQIEGKTVIYSKVGFEYKTMDMVKISRRQQPHPDEKCQLKVTHGSSMNDIESVNNQT